MKSAPGPEKMTEIQRLAKWYRIPPAIFQSTDSEGPFTVVFMKPNEVFRIPRR